MFAWVNKYCEMWDPFGVSTMQIEIRISFFIIYGWNDLFWYVLINNEINDEIYEHYYWHLLVISNATQFDFDKNIEKFCLNANWLVWAENGFTVIQATKKAISALCIRLVVIELQFCAVIFHQLHLFLLIKSTEIQAGLSLYNLRQSHYNVAFSSLDFFPVFFFVNIFNSI